MKKISTLLMLFCAFVGTALAQLPEVSPAPVGGKWAEGTKWYTIKRNNTNPIALSNADANGYLKLNGTTTKTIDGYWCVVGDEANGYQFYNLQAGTTQTLGAYGSEANGRMKMYDLDVTEDGSNTLTKTFDIKTLDGQTYAFVKNHGSTNDWWNERSGYLAYWNSSYAYATNCTGSQYTFTDVTADVLALVDGYKTTAKAALEMISFLGVDAAKTAIDAVATTNCNAFAEIDAIVNGVAQYVAIRNSHTDSRANHFLGVDMTKGKGNGHGSFNYLLDVWSLKYDGAGAFYLYNVNNEVYLGTPSSNGVLTVTPTAGYTFEVVEGNKVKLKLDGQTLHLNNHAGNGPIVSTGWFLSDYDNLEEGEPASQWYVESDFTSFVTSYKTSAIAALDGGITNVCTLLGVDASLVSTAKTAINDIATTDYPTFAAIDAKFNDLADAIAAKDVVFQNSNTENPNRSEVYLATNMNTNKGRGIKTFDYSAVWSLQLAGLDAFYLYNPLNEVYLGKPSDGGSLTDVPVSAYTFELIENNKVELKCVGQTLHVSNNAECTLINHDGNESASRWYVTTIDITAEIQELIDANATNYAETPALGQYPTSAYNALVAAKTTAKTVEEVEAAIAAFKASLNAPVYIISGVHDYANGKAIYYNGSNPEWRWDTKNAFNKAMWFRVLGLTTPEFELNTEYNVVDMSGRNIYNKASIKFETVENWDGVYCLKYGTGDSDYLHLANHSNNLVTNWYRATIKADGTPDSGASAFNVVYIGNSYDLAQLSDELFTAAAELAAVNVPNYTFSAGLNNYDETTKPALDAAIANRTTVLSTLSTADEIAAAKSQLETAIAGVQLNMPVNGKFYRVRCVDQGTNMRRLQSTISNDRLQMIGGDAGINVNSIFCYVDGGLLSYTTGKYINAYNFDAVGTKSTVTFSKAYNGTLGQYNIKINNSRYIYGKKDEIDSGTGNPTDGGYNWWLEEVTTLPVTITEAGYATFYAPVALTLPAEVKAYTVTVNGGWATLNEIEGDVIPANTGVVLEGTAETYNLTVVESDKTISGNDLLGTVAASYVTATAYVLGYVGEGGNKEVGFYTATKNQQDGASWLNNGFKAYLPKPAGSGANALRFNFGGNTTAIESVLNGVDVNAPIYDLSGRRVNNAVKGGIYIQNGKKFIVK